MKWIITFAALVATSASMSAISVNPAQACTYESCAQLVILVCPGRDFVGGSDIGNAEDIARVKARAAGYDPNYCTPRYR
jgi:hypothetical protein